MIRALIFDFDGLIIDTELPDYESWQEIYRSYGYELPLETWGQIVGGTGASDFDPHTHLEKLCGKKLDREEIWIGRRKQYLDTISTQPLLPGVLDYLDEAERIGLKLGVSSSSPENWVRGHLARLGLYQRFQAIKTADDVTRTKPHPELYLKTLEALSVKSDEAIVFEDSPNGVLASKAAGVFTVAVPNKVTAKLPMQGADLRLDSLEDLRLSELLKKVAN